jgi:hypothetical protein
LDDTIQIYQKEIGWKRVDSIQLAKDGVKWQNMNKMMNVQAA